jgi:L-ascorbate metabolism protein UlaG (beta-lactamase superfamily)
MALSRRNAIKLGGALGVALCLALSGSLLQAQSGKVEVHWLGQATFKITTPGGKVIVTDPFLTGNPKTPADYKDLAKLGKVDLVLVTHGHGDHVGTVGRTDGTCDAADLAKRTGAKVFGPAGLIQTMIDLGWLTAEHGVRFGKGGKVQPLGPQITITQVPAEHSSELTVTDPATKKSTTHPGGESAGFIIQMENGFKIYHMGDTGIFGDMKLTPTTTSPISS